MTYVITKALEMVHKALDQMDKRLSVIEAQAWPSQYAPNAICNDVPVHLPYVQPLSSLVALKTPESLLELLKMSSQQHQGLRVSDYNGIRVAYEPLK